MAADSRYRVLAILFAGYLLCYMDRSWNILHPNELRPFGEAVIPLAKQAGLAPVAAAHPQVLEGTWPEGNMLFVQKYDSMEELHRVNAQYADY